VLIRILGMVKAGRKEEIFFSIIGLQFKIPRLGCIVGMINGCRTVLYSVTFGVKHVLVFSLFSQALKTAELQNQE